MASAESRASLLPPCGVCEEPQSCLLRLPCHDAHRLCRSFLDTILTLPEPPCPWCRAVVDEDRCELLLFGPIACQECGETKGAEETAFCEACEAVFCLRCVSFKHPREHSIRPFQDPSLLRSSLTTSLSSSSSAKAAFVAKLAAAAELLWREGATEAEAAAEALRDRLPGGLKDDGKRMEISEKRAAEMNRRYARLAGLGASNGDAADGPPIRQLVLEESAEALAARIRKSFDPERRDEPQARPGAQEADVPGPSRLSAPPDASSSSATVAGSSSLSSAESVKKKRAKGARISPLAAAEGPSAPALPFQFQCIRCYHFDHHKNLCPFTTSQVDIMHREHRCRNCRRMGHWDHECRGLCQSCGAPGHRTANCPAQPCKFCHQDDHVASDCPEGRRRGQALSRP